MAVLNSEGIVLAINRAFTNCFGYEEKDIIDKNATILFTEKDQKEGLLEKELAEVLAKGQSNDNNYLVNKNNERTWVSGESVLVKNKHGDSVILKVIQNIHQQKNYSIALESLNTLNERILSTINDVVMVLDRNLKVITTNKAFFQLFNTTHEKVADVNLDTFLKLSETNQKLHEDLWAAVATNTGFSDAEIELTIPNNGKKFFEIICTPLSNPNNQDFLLTIHDITVPKELENEREDIIGFVTHELRNPLSNLILSNEVLKEAVKENNPALVNDMLSRVERSIERMNKMVAGLYESTKVKAGQLHLELSAFNFGQMVKEAIETLTVLQPSFDIIMHGDANFQMVADRHRLIQVITNYLSNAIKYSNGKHKVTLTITNAQDLVTVAVKDEGLGIPKKYLPHVFERFFRAKTTSNIEGIGLGLFLCSRIIDAHQGRVWAESEENKGSVFYFSIPTKPSFSSSDKLLLK